MEEIFVNIAHYAYHPGIGKATVRCRVEEAPLRVTIQFLDNGVPFDPLKKPDADTSLSADEREIGGLGILMSAYLLQRAALILLKIKKNIQLEI